MPMNDNGYIWRPNDNSAKTDIRYSIEADKWVKALKSAEFDNRPTDYNGTFAFIGLVIQLILTLLTGLVIILIKCFKGVMLLFESRKTKPTNNDEGKTKNIKDDPWTNDSGVFDPNDYEEIKL